jgi:molecular chaperone GrpE
VILFQKINYFLGKKSKMQENCKNHSPMEKISLHSKIRRYQFHGIIFATIFTMTEEFSSNMDDTEEFATDGSPQSGTGEGVDDQFDESAEYAQEYQSSAFRGDIIGELSKTLENTRKEADGYKDAMVRTMADFENHKKRTQKERAEIRNHAIAEIIEVLLPTLDNFELGLDAAEQQGNRDLVVGFAMILANLKNSLASYGLREIFPLNEKFDMHFHECVHRVIDNEAEPDTIPAVHRKGYKLNDKLLRPAIVTVSYHEEQSNASE